MVADDGYEPTRTADTMQQQLLRQAAGLCRLHVGNVGTPTAVDCPAAIRSLTTTRCVFGAFTGADLLRRWIRARYFAINVFNYRASYAEETDAVVRYLVKMRHLRGRNRSPSSPSMTRSETRASPAWPKPCGALRGDDSAILRLDYERNTVDVDKLQVAGLRAHKTPIKAVVMVAVAYRAAAKFIEKTRDLYPTMIYTNVSFVEQHLALCWRGSRCSGRVMPTG